MAKQRKWVLPSEGYYRAVEPENGVRNGLRRLPKPPKGRAGTSPRPAAGASTGTSGAGR